MKDKPPRPRAPPSTPPRPLPFDIAASILEMESSLGSFDVGVVMRQRRSALVGVEVESVVNKRPLAPPDRLHSSPGHESDQELRPIIYQA